MRKNTSFLSIIMPALNEQKNIEKAIEEVLSAFRGFNLDAEVIVVNDGSTDLTPKIVEKKINQYPQEIKVIHHRKPLGIGRCFWDGVRKAKGKFVCMLPADNENEPEEIFRYIKLFDDVDVIIPFVFNKEVRPKLRNFISSLYSRIINFSFATSLNYTNGTVLYRKSVLERLEKRTSGFFFQTDILIRLVKRGYLFAEVPYRLNKRKSGGSKAFSFKSLKEVSIGYLMLLRDIYFRGKREKTYSLDSQTLKRKTSP